MVKRAFFLFFLFVCLHELSVGDETTTSNSGDETTTSKSGGKTPVITKDLVNMYCGDPFRRYHYRQYDENDIFNVLYDLDACCYRHDNFRVKDKKKLATDCCLTQGSKCEDGGIPCCKQAKCSKTDKGEMRCPFEAGFWKTSRMLDVPAVEYWKPSMVPRLCQNKIYTYYRDLSNNTSPANPHQYISGCCSYQDTTEASHIRKHCCVNTNRGCCFANGKCIARIPSFIVAYIERENDFQKKVSDDVLMMVQNRL